MKTHNLTDFINLIKQYDEIEYSLKGDYNLTLYGSTATTTVITGERVSKELYHLLMFHNYSKEDLIALARKEKIESILNS